MIGTNAAADFPGVTANGNATVNGTITDIASFGTLSYSTIAINFGTSSGSGSNANTAAAGSLTVGAFDFTSSLSKALAVGDSVTASGTLFLTGQTLNSVANTIASNESTLAATLAPNVSGATGSMSIGLNNATANVLQTTSTGTLTVSANIINGTGANASNILTVNSSGTGAVILSGANNTYSGGTTVTAGTLLVNGTNSGAGAMNVNGGTLGGSGTVDCWTTIAAGATLAPGATGGASIAKLTLGTSATGTMAINGNYTVNITGSTTPNAGTTYDQFSTAGALTLNTTSSTLTVTTTSAVGLAAGQVLYIGLNGGAAATVGTFAGLTEGSTVMDNQGDAFSISYLANGDSGALGNDISLTVVTAVPEPATIFGGLLVVGTLGWRLRRQIGQWCGQTA